MRARALILACAVGSAVTASPAIGAESQLALRIGIPNTDVGAQPLYAQAQGFFAQAGIAAEIHDGLGGAEVLRAVERGELDAGFANIVSAAAAIQHGAPLIVVAPGAMYDPASSITVLVQAAGSRFANGSDLNGKTIATPSAHDLGELGTAAWIDQHGGDSRTVHFVHGIGMTSVPQALAEHRIDAAEMSEPALSDAEKRGAVTLVARTFDSIGNRFPIGVYVVSTRWAQAHPDGATRLRDALRTTAVWANAHRPQTAPVLATHLAVAPQVVAAMTRATYGDVLTPEMLQPLLDIAAKYGALEPMRADTLIGTH